MLSPEHKHPDFRFDTPGSCPGPSSQAQSLRFASPLPDDGEIMLHDVFPWIENLNTETYLASKYLAQLVRTGGKLVQPIVHVCLLTHWTEHKLPRHQRLLLQDFNYKVNTDISGVAYSKLCIAFPTRLRDLPTHSQLRTCIGVLSGMRDTRIDCCVNSCVAYTWPYTDELVCPYCPEAH
jgi:hypothetical protein